MTLIIAIVPMGMYMISAEDLTWFCDTPLEDTTVTSNDGMKTYFAGDEGRFVSKILMAKEYVDMADESVNARSSLMCKDSQCCCDTGADTTWSAWNGDDSAFVAPSDWCNGGTISNWSDCAAEVAAERTPTII